jgi:hypothetical protein
LQMDLVRASFCPSVYPMVFTALGSAKMLSILATPPIDLETA